MRKYRVICIILILLTLSAGVKDVMAKKTKTIKVTVNMDTKKRVYKAPKALKRVRKVKIKNSNPSVVTVKYQKKKHRIKFDVKKQGKSTITIRYKKKILKYIINVQKTKKSKTSYEKSREAFKIQNQMRAAGKLSKLEWSEELYNFALYRLKNSGMDDHKNLGSDAYSYFGNYYRYKKLLISENQTGCHSSARATMNAWRASSPHYKNLMTDGHVCGAIAEYKETWCAVFFDKDKDIIDDYKSFKLKKVTIKRLDDATGEYIDDFQIGYYEADDKWNTMHQSKSKTGEDTIYLEVGKTYIFYEQIVPDGCEKAKKLKITVTDEKDEVIVISSSDTNNIANAKE